MELDYENIIDSLAVLYMAKRIYDNGRKDILDRIDAEIDPDDSYWFANGALEMICDYVDMKYDEEREVTSYYFSDESIMEYFKYCRQYAKIKGVKLQDCDYMKKANDKVHEQLESGCYYCDFHMETKINHEWASGIVFQFDANFYEFEALLLRILEIISFFRSEVVELKKEMDKHNAIQPIQEELRVA